MKKSVLIGIIAIIFMSATSISSEMMSFKPEPPKKIIVKGFPYYEEVEMQNYINGCVREGYSLKSLNGGGGSGGSYWFIVMEKY